MAKVYLILIIGSILGGIGYGAYKYWQWSDQTISILEENNAKLELATESLQQTVEIMNDNAVRNEQLNSDLTYRLQRSNDDLRKLRKVLAEIDLTQEALSDPAGLEERVDNAVDRLIKEIEAETTPPGRRRPTVASSVRDTDTR